LKKTWGGEAAVAKKTDAMRSPAENLSRFAEKRHNLAQWLQERTGNEQ
jgi:hypothetical protein